MTNFRHQLFFRWSSWSNKMCAKRYQDHPDHNLHRVYNLHIHRKMDAFEPFLGLYQNPQKEISLNEISAYQEWIHVVSLNVYIEFIIILYIILRRTWGSIHKHFRPSKIKPSEPCFITGSESNLSFQRLIASWGVEIPVSTTFSIDLSRFAWYSDRICFGYLKSESISPKTKIKNKNKHFLTAYNFFCTVFNCLCNKHIWV